MLVHKSSVITKCMPMQLNNKTTCSKNWKVNTQSSKKAVRKSFLSDSF